MTEQNLTTQLNLPLVKSGDCIYVIGEEVETFYGIELEYLFAPDTHQDHYLRIGLGESYEDVDHQRMLARQFLNTVSPVIRQSIFADRNNEELVLEPISLKAHQQLKYYYSDLFSHLQKGGFVTISPRDEIGMHISIDKEDLSTETLLKMVDFCFQNSLLFLVLSGRVGPSTKLADMRILLGDRYRNWSIDKIEQRYIQTRKNISYAYDKNVAAEYLGIRFYTDNIPYIQWTQFNSTLSSELFLVRIELLASLKTFAESEYYSTEVEKYITFLETSSTAFPHVTPAVRNIMGKIKNYNTVPPNILHLLD
jgi:hypothetical protein